MTLNKGNFARFTERFGCYEVGDVVEVKTVERGEKTDLVHFIGLHGNGNCYAHRIEKVQNPKEVNNDG